MPYVVAAIIHNAPYPPVFVDSYYKIVNVAQILVFFGVLWDTWHFDICVS